MPIRVFEEHDDLFQAARLHQVHHRRALLVAAHLVVAICAMVLAVALRAATSISTAVTRYERPSLRISATVAENKRSLELRGQQPDDAFQVAEAGVEHAVGFVQHQMPTWLRFTFFCSTWK